MKQKFHGVVFITKRCQLRCRHCTLWKDGSDISLDTLEKILEYGPRKLNLLGGEPLLHPKLDEILKLIDVPVTIQTNALLVPEKIDLLKNVRQVICSVEGVKENTDFIRGDGVFEKVVASVKMLHDNGIPVLLRSSLWEGNLEDVPKLVDLAREIGVGLYFYPMLGTPALSTSQMLWLFEELNKYENAWLDLPNYFCWLGRRSYCSAGESRLAFDTDGKVYPCQWMPEHVLGYVGDDFTRIEENADFFSTTMKRPPPECIGCKWYSICRGGCLLTPWYLGCPLRPQLRRYLEFHSEDMGEKSEHLTKLLSGVVTC